MRPLGRALAGIVGSDFSDPTNERLIYLAAAGLAIVGLALLIGTIMWWRHARQEHPVLAPLEVMSNRSWEKAPESDRRKRLDQVRAAGAGTGVVEEEFVHSEPVDLQALVRSVPQAFDDLREPRVEEPVVAEEVVDEEVVEEGVVDEAAAEEPVAEEVVAEEDVVEETAAEEPVAEEDVVEEAEPVAEEVEAEPDVDDDVEAEAVEPASDEPEPEPSDATSVSTERPSEVVSAGPNDSSN
jgi:hypothetical protein